METNNKDRHILSLPHLNCNEVPVVAIAIVYRPYSNKILLIKKKTEFGEYWNFPGGKVKKEELQDPSRAAKREVEEETNVKCNLITSSPLGHRKHPISKAFLMYYFFEYKSGVKFESQLDENIVKIKWVDPEDAIEKLGPNIFPKAKAQIKSARKFYKCRNINRRFIGYKDQNQRTLTLDKKNKT